MISDDILAKLTKTLEESNKKTIEEANRLQTEVIKQHIRKEISVVKENFEEELNRRTNEFENKYVELKRKYDKLEKNLKKNNIIIFGLESTTENLGEIVINSLNQHLGLKLVPHDIDNVYTIGKQKNKKPIIVRLISYLKKQEILKNSKKLKGTSIGVAEELTFDEIKENKILRQHLKDARSKNLTAYIKNKKLIVNGHEYTAEQLADEEEDTDTEETGKPNDDEVLNEAKDSARRLNNSAPSTPTTTRQELVIEQKFKENEVPEEEQVEDSKKRRGPKVNQPVSRIVRSSRITSNK